MRTNKECPMYARSTPLPTVAVAMTEEQEEEMEKSSTLVDQDLVNIDGTKIILSKTLIEQWVLFYVEHSLLTGQL